MSLSRNRTLLSLSFSRTQIFWVLVFHQSPCSSDFDGGTASILLDSLFLRTVAASLAQPVVTKCFIMNYKLNMHVWYGMVCMAGEYKLSFVSGYEVPNVFSFPISDRVHIGLPPYGEKKTWNK